MPALAQEELPGFLSVYWGHMFVNEVIYLEYQFLGLLDGGEWLYEEDAFHASGKIWRGNLHFTDEMIQPLEAGVIDVIQTHLNVPQNATVHWNGFPAGQFQQTFTLPSSINSERAEADYTNGVLTLNLPKAEHVKARTVKVTAKK